MVHQVAVKVVATWRLDSEHALTQIDESTLEKADYLQQRLIRRLEAHVDEKVPKGALRDCWCWHFTAKKLGHMAAVMVLLNHIKKDLECLADNQAFLSGKQCFREVTETCVEDGVYLHFDNNSLVWIRAGMVAGRSLWERGFEHKTKARLESADAIDSRFYTSYPRNNGPKPESAGRRGWFHNLSQMIALGYPVDRPLDPLLDILDIDEEDNQQLSKLNFRMKNDATPSLADKQRRGLHYLGETAHGLCLAPAHNVSTNAGWEQATGLY